MNKRKTFKFFLTVGLVVWFSLGGPTLDGRARAADGEKVSPAMGHDSAGKVVVARVNGAEINMEMLMDSMLNIAQKKYGRREISELVALKIKKEATDILIVEELAFQKARAAVGDIAMKDVEKKIEELKEEKGGEKGFVEYLLMEEGLTVEGLRQKLFRTTTVKVFLDKEIGANIKITEEELKAAYNGAVDKYFSKKEEVQVTDIVFFLDVDLEETRETILKIREKIIQELDNDATRLVPDGTFVVRENIKLDKNANKKRFDIAKEIGPSGISGPIEVGGTFHMIQLTGYQPEVRKEFEEVRDYLTDEITSRKRQAAIDRWVSGLKEGAKIEIVDVTIEN